MRSEANIVTTVHKSCWWDQKLTLL